MIRAKIPNAEAVAVATFIADLDTEDVITHFEATRLWVALQDRCPHVRFSEDCETGRSCDVCMIPERAYGWQRKGFIVGPAR